MVGQMVILMVVAMVLQMVLLMGSEAYVNITIFELGLYHCLTLLLSSRYSLVLLLKPIFDENDIKVSLGYFSSLHGSHNRTISILCL